VCRLFPRGARLLSSELDRERDYVSTLYERLDALKAEAREKLASTRRDAVGGNHQSRSERDAYARLYEDTLAQLGEVDDRLAFGRLELREPDETTSPATSGGSDGEGRGFFRYIGRIGLRDREHHPILLDWRVPGASAFYQATAATPMGARARRHLTLSGRTVTRLEDEVFDASLLDRGDAQLQGEGALMAALTAQRTGRMTDIVATIQAEQDRIIRSPLDGVLVVQGGPGTGKTAVALHRAAYLLYSHRERLRGSGVLVVGPSKSFLRYIEQVLPSLGESGVVLASLGSLYPGVDASRDDAPDVAALKGSAKMADLLKRAVRSRQVVPTEPTEVDVDGERMVVQPELVRDALRRAQERGKPHNEARVAFNKSALASSSTTSTRDPPGSLRSRRSGPRPSAPCSGASAAPSSRSATFRSSTRRPSCWASSTRPSMPTSGPARRSRSATSRTPSARSRTCRSRGSSPPATSRVISPNAPRA
jgi:DNA helicase IV